MEAQAQGKWSPIALRVVSGERQKALSLHLLTSRTEWTGAIFKRQQSVPTRACGIVPAPQAQGLLWGGGPVKWVSCSAGNAPTECSARFLRPVVPRFLNLAGAERTCCAGSGIRVVLPFPGKVGRELDSRRPERWARVLQLPSPGSCAARAPAVARRRPRVSRLRVRLAAREPAFSDEEWVTRTLISSSRCVCPVSYGRGTPSASPAAHTPATV